MATWLVVHGGRRSNQLRRGSKLWLAAALVCGLVVGVEPGSSGASSVPVPESCQVDGTVAQTGTPLVSAPMKAALDGLVLELPLEVEATVDSEIRPGGVLTDVVSLRFDLAAQAAKILTDQVHPAVAAAGYPQLVASSWVELTLPSTSIRLPLPAGAPLGQPVSAAIGPGSAARFDGDSVVVDLGSLHADTRLGSSQPTTVVVGWRATDGGAPGPRTVELPAPTLRFASRVDVGLSFSGAPLVGGIAATWACTPHAGVGPLATTAVADQVGTTTSLPGLPGSGPPPVVVTPTTTPPQSWPSSAVRPTGCEVSGFDAYGGWTGRTLSATGRFRTQRIDGRWWLVDPLGHPFFSQGVNHVTFDGTEDRNGVAAYRDAVTARYGTRDAWAEAQVRRFADWGYNTAGGWSDDEVTSRMPYVLLVNLTSQDFGTGVMEDLWAPAWRDAVQARAQAAADAHRDDPNLIGYWTDNELHWGPDWRPGHLFDAYLQRPASSAGKQALLSWLQDRFGTFAAFQAAFTTSATSWADLADPASVSSWSAGGQAARDAWVGQVAEQYFSVTVGSLRAADPGHLELGPRFIAQTTGRPVLEAAARWVDVASFNDYAIDAALLPGLRNADPTYLPTDGALAAQEQVLDKPILISEWGFRAADSGLPNSWPPLFPTLRTQDERAGAYQQFVGSLLGSSWVVGQHFFEHADEPAAGRFDGEDSNFGLVDAHDDPYGPVVEVSRWMHDCAYARLVPKAGSTTTTEPGGTGPAAGGPGDAPGAEPVDGRATYTG